MTGATRAASCPLIRDSLLELASSCFVGDLEAAAGRIVQHSMGQQGGYVCLCNVHVLTTALDDVELRAALSGAAIRFPDGEPVAWLLRRLGHRRARRIGGPDLLALVVDRGRTARLRHFFAGSTEQELERLIGRLMTQFRGVDIVGQHAPPYSAEPEVEDVAIAKIRASRAQVVWVGLGAPKQEAWMARAAPALPGITLVGVGAAFDFISGAKARAPALVQRVGLEWLFRMASEPRRLTTRYLRSNSVFIARTALELARGKSSSTS